MYPKIHIGSFELPTFGLTLAVGFLLGLWIVRRRAEARGIDALRVTDGLFWGILVGVLGARITFIVQELPYYLKHTDQLLDWRFQGLTSFGGILFGFVFMVFWCRAKKLPLLPVLDVVGPAFLIAHAIGRVGCLLNGCCFGNVCDPSAPFAVSNLDTGRTHVPAQLFDSGMCLIGAWLLTRIERVGLSPGQSTGLAISFYGISRFIYEFWRAGTADQVARGLASSVRLGDLPITRAQSVALLFALLGLAMFFALKRTGGMSQEARVAS